MRNKSFFESTKGQLSLYESRQNKVLTIEYKAEPKTKKSISIDEKRLFRKYVHEHLQKIRRRKFTSEIIVKIDFTSAHKKSPPVQTFVKNYLDLLHKSTQEDNLKEILFKDDSQIKILIANIYYIDSNNSLSHSPSIRIAVYPFNSFKKDVNLVERIIRNKFSDEDSISFHNYKDDDEEDQNELERARERLFETLSTKLEQKNLSDFYEKTLLPFALYNYQSALLSKSILSASDLTFFYTELGSNGYDSFYDKIQSATIKNILLALNFSEIQKYPNKEGDGRVIKETLGEILYKFREKNSLLFPLKVPISITIVYQEPKTLYTAIDCDNLARDYIIPYVKSIFEPQTYFTSMLVSQEDYNSFGKPQNEILGYEILNIPRTNEAPINGRIGIIIRHGLISRNIWGTINELIQKWKDDLL